MLFTEFALNRITELFYEPYGSARIPDLVQVLCCTGAYDVLEIGCHRGVSTEMWALHCASVVAIDPWPDLEVYRDFQNRVGSYRHVDFRREYSPLPADYFPPGQTFDLVYLDGDHRYETVRDELIAYMPLVRADGYIGGHDYSDTPAGNDGVKRAVDERFGADRVTTFSDGSWVVPQHYFYLDRR
jgi:predicted O-methyltransferase YrrM